MFIITKQQMEAFQQAEVEKFVEISVVFLQENFTDWCEGKGREAIEQFIREMMTFGKQYGIYTEINIQKLMHYKIEFDFDIPLQTALATELRKPDIHEDHRVNFFYEKLIPNNTLNKTSTEEDEDEWWE